MQASSKREYTPTGSAATNEVDEIVHVPYCYVKKHYLLNYLTNTHGREFVRMVLMAHTRSNRMDKYSDILFAPCDRFFSQNTVKKKLYEVSIYLLVATS